jgi:hypothetical protein
MTLNPHLAAKAFSDMPIILSKMRGIVGHPLSYIPHPNLKGPYDVDMDDETKDPPPFGQPGSLYVSIDNELCHRAPILHTDLSHTQLSTSLETLKSDKPFEPSFLANMVMVYKVLHACWGKLSWWSHVRKFSKTKNGQQVYWTLHTILLGGQRVVSTGSAIVTKLQSFRYEGNCKNFNFDKYVNLHVEQHNQHADLQEYGVAPLIENLKTLWFQEGRDPSLNAVKVSINANPANFTDLTLLRMLMWNSSAQTTQPMTQRPNKLPLLPAAGVGAGITHAAMTKDMDPRPLTNARRDLFPNLKSTSRPTLLTGTIQMPSLTS